MMLTDAFLHGKFMHLGTHTHRWLSVCAAFTIKVILSFFTFSSRSAAERRLRGRSSRSLPCISGLCLLGGVTVATEQLGQYDNHVHFIQKQSNLRKFPVFLNSVKTVIHSSSSSRRDLLGVTTSANIAPYPNILLCHTKG